MSLNTSNTTWDLSPLLASDTDPRIPELTQQIQQANQDFVAKWKKRDDYLTEPKVLLEALTDYEKLEATYGTSGNLGYYFSLRSSQNQNNPEVQAGFNKAHELGTALHNEIQFFELNLAGISPEKQQIFLNTKNLAPYHHFLERIFAYSSHVLSEPEERILNLKALPARTSWVKLTSKLLGSEERDVLLEDGKQEKAVLETILSLLQSQNQEVRDTASTAINDILHSKAEVAEAEINALFADKKTNDELRQYPRPDSSRHLSDDIATEVVDQLIKTVSSRFDLAHRYYKLKAQLLGKTRLAYHERNVRYGSITKQYSYPESLTLVHQTFQDLDPEFAQILEQFSQQSQFDVFPKKHKQGGAFCAHNLINQPTYILLNHTNSLQDVLTIAHEVGHGINNELIRKRQSALYFGTPMATAEVASTFMEDFVLERLLKEADAELKLALLMMKLNDDINTIFRQVACYQFEQELHQTFRQTGYLSHVQIGQIFQNHMQAYMGPSVEQSPGSENWWIYWSHIRSFFYVYSYASGLLISKSLQASLKADPTFITQIKHFLSAGTSESPETLFANLGITIREAAFWEQGLAEVDRLLDQTEALASQLSNR